MGPRHAQLRTFSVRDRALFVHHWNQTDAGGCKDIHCIHECRAHDAKHVGNIVRDHGFDKGFTRGHFHCVVLGKSQFFVGG